ncbi:FecCD family ABC transporter permease [Fusobacterium sp.]|uniref:FecCD family ABC transporter permease n=1 Tax=Fusobacterium sp. TaxID=68766 RepID=UPI00396C9391
MMIKKEKFNIFIFLMLIGIILLSLFYGAVKVPLEDIIKILFNKLLGMNFEISKKNFTSIVFYVRFPRVMCATLVGGALGVCGCAIQSMLKNPIADSGIIGISSGASLGAIIAIATGMTTRYMFGMPILAVIFALLIAGIIYRFSVSKGKTDSILLVLSGIAISSFVGAISSFILTSLVDSQIKEYLFWSIGNLSGLRWEHFLAGVGPIMCLSFFLMHYGKELNILLLGDEEAKSVGVNIKTTRKKILALVAFLTSISVCIAGNIGFVGLIVPHILRKIIGSDNRKLLKSSFLAGAFFLVLSDLISRVALAPKEISVGIITCLIGAPYFIYLIMRIRKEGRGI